jgi:uncharacterized protein
VSAPVGVIDTNVLVAGVITGDSQAPTARIVDAMLAGAFPFLLSIALLAEYRAVLLRPRIRSRHGLGEEEVDALLVGLAANAAMREPTQSGDGEVDVDAHLLALIATHDEAVLVTGDQALLKRAPAARAESPASFAARLSLRRRR